MEGAPGEGSFFCVSFFIKQKLNRPSENVMFSQTKYIVCDRKYSIDINTMDIRTSCISLISKKVIFHHMNLEYIVYMSSYLVYIVDFFPLNIIIFSRNCVSMGSNNIPLYKGDFSYFVFTFAVSCTNCSICIP